MRTAALIARLQAQVESLRFVGGAMDFDEARLATLATPSAFVIPAGEAAEQSRMLGAHDQRLTQTFAVAIVLRAIRSASADQSDALGDLREAIRAALIGWQETGDVTAVQFQAGELLYTRDGLLVWQDSYTREARLRTP